MTDKKRQVCDKCGFKIRSKNHDNGHHHQNGRRGKVKVGRR